MVVKLGEKSKCGACIDCGSLNYVVLKSMPICICFDDEILMYLPQGVLKRSSMVGTEKKWGEFEFLSLDCSGELKKFS